MYQKEKVLEGKIDPERPAAMALEKKSHYQENYQGTRNWANLPEDILGKIMRTLKFSERLCMTATCKGWRIPVYGVNNPLYLDGLPWLYSLPFLVSSDRLNEFKLYEPGNPKPYFIGKDIINKGGNKLLGAQVFSSKFGWVVFLKHLVNSATWAFILYSPFAEYTIQLPDLSEKRMCFPLFTFSNIPSKHDCIFFLLNLSSVQVHLYIYRNGEREWKRYDCDVSLFGCNHRHGVVYSFKTSNNIVYLDGILYCMFSCGDNHTLATFNVSEQEWSVKTTSVISADGIDFHRVTLLESDKGLWALYKTFLDDSKFRIFKYDCSELITIRSLEDHIFFVDVLSAFSIEALGEVRREFCSRIYYKFNSCESSLSYFSIKDNQINKDSIIYVTDSPVCARGHSYFLFLDVSSLHCTTAMIRWGRP